MGKLDQLLTWLWRVHGVDYYAGTEVAEPDAEQRAGPRPTLRCPRPEDGEQVRLHDAGQVDHHAACELHNRGRLRCVALQIYEASSTLARMHGMTCDCLYKSSVGKALHVQT